jgi:D-3-phosphoglycerate dehydrogenase / 2-oxoglutarate reductase
LKILVVYDAYVPKEYFERAFAEIGKTNTVRFEKLNEFGRQPPQNDSERSIREYSGNPKEIASLLQGDDVLVVHTAPVTEEVLKASPNLKAVFCARGGPVNIDVAAATRMKIPVVSAPGRNADAVADITIAFMIILARKIIPAYTSIRPASGVNLSRSVFEAFFGNELGGKVLGLVGYGNVGARVAKRALAFGMEVLVYDPYVDKSRIEAPGIKTTDYDTLVKTSDFVSLHVREAPENNNMFGAKQFGMMKPTAYFINTARGSLLDEDALYDAITSKMIAGAAMDVMKVEPIDRTSKLFELSNVVITPHIAGASHEVRFRGAEIIGKQVEKWLNHEHLDGVLNPQVMQ